MVTFVRYNISKSVWISITNEKYVCRNLGKELKAGLEAKYKQSPGESKTVGKSTAKAKSTTAMIQDERHTKLTKLAAKYGGFTVERC